MNKKDLVQHVASETSLANADVEKVVSAVLGKMSRLLATRSRFDSPLVQLNPVKGGKQAVLRLTRHKAGR